MSSDDDKSHLINNMHAFYSEKHSIGSLAEAAFVRPGMYTINGTLEEVGAFLEGFYSGMSTHNRNPNAQADAQRWFDFCVWAAKYLDDSTPDGWYDLFTNLRRLYVNDTEAFLRLVELYRAFEQAQTDAHS